MHCLLFCKTGSLFEAYEGFSMFFYGTSVHFHFKVALSVNIKQNTSLLRVIEQISDSVSLEEPSKGFPNMEMTTYAPSYKEMKHKVVVFDHVR